MNRTGRWILMFALLLTAAFAVVRARAESVTAPAGSTLEFLQQMDAKYAPLMTAGPEATRGTGFKPYERYKWFVERRLDSATGNETPGARWQAWEQMRQLEDQQGTRSETWYSLGPINVAGRCLALAVHPTDPSTVYAGFASGGIWRTTDAGLTWTPLGDLLPSMAVSCIAIDSANPNRIWIGTGEGWGNLDAIHGTGVLMTTDAGATWNQAGLTYTMLQGRDVHALSYHAATGTLLAATSNGLHRSTDGGVTFTPVFSGGRWLDVQRKKGSDNVVFATVKTWTNNGVYRSADDGFSFTQLGNGLPTTDIGNNRLALTAANPERLYFAMATNSGGTMAGIWTSSNSGDNWTQVTGTAGHYGTQGWYNLTLSVSPVDENLVFSGGVQIYRSTNGGVNFSTVGSGIVHVDHHATAWGESDPSAFWVGSDGGVWRTINNGGYFSDKNTGLTTLQFYAVNQSDALATRALGGTQDNGTYMYNNALIWDQVLGGDGFFTEAGRTNGDELYGELYFGDHYRSTNGGATMTPANSGIGEQGPWSTPTWMDYANPSILYTAHNSAIYKSTNKMVSWVDTNNPAAMGAGRSIHQCRTQPNYVAVLSGTKIWLTTNAGTTWVNKTGTLTTGGNLSDIYIHPTDPNTWVVTLSTYSTTIASVAKTTDAGTTWTAIDAGLPNEPANTIEMDPQHPDWYFVGTDLGVYLSQDAGATWAPFNTGLPHVVVSDLRLHDTARVLRAGTHGRGMWEVDISGLDGTTAVDTPHPTVQPLTLKVMGNPASDRTVLRYGARSAGPARLALYDTQGRQVRACFEQFVQPILGTAEVDLRDLPAGVYFARLDQGSNSVSQKLVVQR